MSLRAGIATRDITPRKPLFLVGYPHEPRVSTGVHDPLLASALFLNDGKTSLLTIAVDVLFVSPETVAHCRAAIARTTGIPASNILIAATHTHSAPITATMLAWENDPVVPPINAEYMAQFHDGIIGAATAAVVSAQPAQLAITTARVSGVGSNRLSPSGPFDPEAGLIAIRVAGKLAALNLIYGMHPTVLHEDSKLVSSDFPHFTRERLKESFPGLTTVYQLAPCGNLSPRYDVRGQTFAEAERLGRRLGDLAVRAVNKLRDADFRSDITLGVAVGHAEMLPNQFSSVAEAEAGLQKARTTFEQLKRENAPHGPRRTAECVVFGSEELLTLAKAQAAGRTVALQEKYRRAEVQVFRIGDAFLVAWPGEQFVEYALQLKQATAARVFAISLANGELQGYIVTPEARDGASYEAAFALFAAESGERLVATALRLVKELRP